MKTNASGAHNSEVTISVVIPCFNGKRSIRKTLDAVCGQKTRHSFEVIVVDSSDDGTPEIIASTYPQVRLIRLERQTLPGSGRNLGIANARGTYVAFTDADCVPDPDWLDRIVTTFQAVDTEAVGGCLLNGYPKVPTAWVSHLIEFNEWTESTPAGFVKNIPSANLAYRRDTFFRLGVQFTDIFPSEDTILNWTMQEKGAKIYFDPKIRVVHLNRVAFSKLFRHQYKLGLASAEARRTTTLPGRVFVRYPILGLALPAIRWARTFGRLLRKDLTKLLIFLGLTPIYLAATTAWSVGFVSRGHFDEPFFFLHRKNGEGAKGV